MKQNAILAEMIWKVDEIVSHLSGFYHLGPGDLIMTVHRQGSALSLPETGSQAE